MEITSQEIRTFHGIISALTGQKKEKSQKKKKA